MFLDGKSACIKIVICVCGRTVDAAALAKERFKHAWQSSLGKKVHGAFNFLKASRGEGGAAKIAGQHARGF
jgi:hypothetical protein